MASARAEEGVEACVRWAREQGAEVHAAVAGRTLVAHQSTTAGAQQPHLVVAVPRHLLLTAAAACDTHAPFGESFQTLQREGLDELGMLTLLLTLHAAMGPESFWHAYVRSLPSSYQDPLWWGAEALAEVEGSPLQAHIKEQARRLRRLHTKWTPRFAALCVSSAAHTAAHAETLERMKDVALLRWARSTVASRTFRLPANESTGAGAAVAEAALVPVADLLDHCPGTPARWSRDDVTGGFRFHTDAVVGAGAAFYADYGDNGNGDLVLSHGFALWPNAADRYVLKLAPEDLHTGSARSRLLARCALGLKHAVTVAAPLPDTLWRALHVSLMHVGEVQRLLSLPDPDAWLAQHPPCAKLQWGMNVWFRSTLDDTVGQLVHGADMAADEAQLDLLLVSSPGIQLDDAAGTRGLVEERAMAVAYRLGVKRVMRACTARLAQLTTQCLMAHPPRPQPAVAADSHHANRRAGGGDSQSLVEEEDAMQWRRTLRLMASVRQGEPLGSAPAVALLHAAAAREDEALGPALTALDVAADVALAVLLLKETAAAAAHDAPWAAYVRRLRRLQPPAVRLAECAQCADTTAAVAAQTEAEELRDRAERELLPVVQACGAAVMGGDVSMEQLCWALKVVDELAVEMPPSPDAPPALRDGGLVLGAVVDWACANTMTRAVIRLQWDADSAHVTAVAVCPLPADAVLSEPLAGVDNMTRLLLLGLPSAVDADNDAESFELRLALPEDDPLADDKARVLRLAALQGPHHLQRRPDDALLRRVLCALAVICAPDLEAVAAEVRALRSAAEQAEASEARHAEDAAHAERVEAAQAMELCDAELMAALQRAGFHTAGQALHDVLTDARDQLDDVVLADDPSDDCSDGSAAPPLVDEWHRAAAEYRIAQRAILHAWIQHLENLG